MNTTDSTLKPKEYMKLIEEIPYAFLKAATHEPFFLSGSSRFFNAGKKSACVW